MISNSNFDRVEFGRRIRQIRIDHGMTQSELADTLNISKSFLSNIENGKRGMDIEIYIELCYTFNITLDHLVLGYERFLTLPHPEVYGPEIAIPKYSEQIGESLNDQIKKP